MNKKYLGIREIAELANVSVATISRAINTPEKVSKETLDKVNSIIKANNYVPNLQAKDMYSQTNKSIAIFISDLTNQYFLALVKTLNRLAFQNGYTLLICNTENNPILEREYLKYCIGMRTRGIIFTEGSNNNIDLSQIQMQNIVFHDRIVSQSHSSVVCDNKKGMRLLVDYLYNLNHRKFAFIGYAPSFISIESRKAEFINSLSNKNIEVPNENIFKCDLTHRAGVDAFDYICTLPDRPTAIICANDSIARGFIMRANKMGIKIPDNFSVVGFDGYESEYFYPHLTTIKQNISLISKELFNEVISDEVTPHHIITDVSLIIGDSCKYLD